MMLRLQQERMTAGLIPSLREYSRYWGLTLDKLRAHARPDVLIMHPGPVNRGDRAVARGRRRPLLGHPRPGEQGRGRAHGRAVPAGRRQGRGGGMSQTRMILIRNGRVVDPANALDAVQDVLIDDGVVKRVGPRLGGDRTAPRSSTPRARSCAPGSSTSTCTCASRATSTRRRWPRAPGPRPPAASPPCAAWPTPTR